MISRGRGRPARMLWDWQRLLKPSSGRRGRRSTQQGAPGSRRAARRDSEDLRRMRSPDTILRGRVYQSPSEIAPSRCIHGQGPFRARPKGPRLR